MDKTAPVRGLRDPAVHYVLMARSDSPTGIALV